MDGNAEVDTTSSFKQYTSATEKEVLKLLEANQLKAKCEEMVGKLAQSLTQNSQSNKKQITMEIGSLISHVLNIYVTKQSGSIDQDSLVKLISLMREKAKSASQSMSSLNSQPTTSMFVNGRSPEDEVDILLIEVINLKGQEIMQIQHRGVVDNQLKPLCLLLQQLYQQSVIPSKTIVTHLDESLLNSSGILDSKLYQQRRRKAMTQHVYEQQKFNLIREENEGFSKLIVELNQCNISMANIDNVKANVEALIGYFNLDPNRVLDIILDSFENNIWNQESYLTLLKDFKSENIAQVMGFKFHNYLEKLQELKKEQQSLTQELFERTVPKEIFLLTAILIKYEMIQFEDIWPHLGQFQETKDEIDEVQSLLNKQIKLTQYCYKSQFEVIMNREAYEASQKQRAQEQEEIKNLREEMPYNFRLCLLQSFVRINQWDKVEEILGAIYNQKLDLTLHKGVLNSMFEALHWFIEPAYSQISKTKKLIHIQSNSREQNYYLDSNKNPGNIRQATSGAIFFEDIIKVMKCLNIYIAFDQVLFQKLCIVMKHYLRDNTKAAIQIAGEVLLPALSLIECNNQISQHVWDIISQADVNTRYDLYHLMITQTYLSNTQLIYSMVEAQEGIKNWQRRLSIDTVKQNARQMAKLASGNALIVFNTMIKQAMNYRNMIEAQIQSLQYCTPLALDIVAYSLLRIISDCHEERLDNEANLAEWLSNLAEFAALFFKKYCNVDMSALLNYLLNRMRIDNEYNEMVILKEVIAKMFGWSQFNVNEMTQQQLQSLAGGFVLRLELMSQANQFKRNQKSGDALVSLFWEKTNEKPLSLAFRLMANLAKITQHVINGVTTEQMFLVSTLFDRVQFTFIQFVETLAYLENSPSKYQQLLPEKVERVLAVNYRLPPAYIFFIMRGSLKQIHFLTDDEFNQKVHEFKSILDMHMDQRVEAVTQEKDEQNDYWDEKEFIKCRKEEIWKCLNPKLYTIFWYLQLQSLTVPEETYHDQIKKIQASIEQLKAQGSNQRKNNKEIDRLKVAKQNLTLELQEYQKNRAGVNEFLQRKLKECFDSIEEENLINLSLIFIQYCLYPRLMFSAQDALYSINFIKTLHAHRVPNFNILHAFSQILKCIVPCLHCCTERESENLGIFFLEFFALINHWSKPENWDSECQGYTGFAKMIGSTATIRLQEFQQIAESIHKRFAQNLIVCFQNTKQSMKTQCGLKILNKLSPQFPNQYLIARVLQKHLQQLVDQRSSIEHNLWTLAFGCNTNLLKKMSTMDKPASVIEQERQQKEREQREKEQQEAQRSDKRSSTDQQSKSDKQDSKQSTKQDRVDRDDNTGGESRRKVKEREKEEQKEQKQQQSSSTQVQSQTQGQSSRNVIKSSANNEGQIKNEQASSRQDQGRSNQGSERVRDDRGKKQSKSPTPKRRDRKYSPGKGEDDKRYRDVKRVDRDETNFTSNSNANTNNSNTNNNANDISSRLISKKDQQSRK